MKALVAVLVVCLAAPAFAQSQYDTRELAYLYDLDSATETFCALAVSPTSATGLASTSGASTTVTSTGTPFAEVSVGDLILFGTSSGQQKRAVTAKASSASITVDSNVTLTNASVQFKRISCGTAATSGWFSMYRRQGTIDISIAQLNVTGGIDVRVQCATTGGTARQVYPALTPPTSTASYTNFTAVGGMAIGIPDPWDRCRVGLKIGSADDGGDLTTNQEQVSINLELGK